MIKSLLFYLSILIYGLILFVTLLGYAPSQSVLVSTLLSRLGKIQADKSSMQFTNLQHCGKMFSITAGHYVTLHMIEQIKPDAKLIYLNTELDVAIFETLGPVFPATIARKLPELLDEVYLITYSNTGANQVPLIIRFTVAGFTKTLTIYQGMLFFGASGSGLYDKNGAYLGPVVNMFTGSGFGTTPNGHPIPMQIGLAGGVRTDRLVDVLDKLFCDPPSP